MNFRSTLLINGSPRGRISPSRGIRQGDRLSPYIFILCSEVLSGLCNRASEEGSLKGIRVTRACPRVNHLLFADDTMFFIRANKDSCQTLKRILSQYEEASGQSINNLKSSITFSKRAPATLKNRIKDELNIQKEGGVGKYLRLPEHFGRKKRDLFSSIIDKIRQKGSSWSNRFLSTAGKMTMLQSVLSPIPSYSMTCFKLPVSLCKRIQSEVTRFWWDDRNGKKKMAWTSWDKMTQPKEIGGLGFRDFQAFNDAFLGKLSWRILHNPDILLSRVLLGKYCPEESFLTCTDKTSSSHGWKGILIGRDLIVKNMGWVVGNGNSITVWYSPWLSLTEQEGPMGPAPEAEMNMTVSDLFLEETNEWDEGKLHQLFPQIEEQIKAIKPSLSGAPDKRVWLGTNTGEYTTKSGYQAAIKTKREERGNIADINRIDWFKSVWKLTTAPKIKLFLWKVFQNALPVGELLAARNISVDTRCKRCGELESINHLFLHCPYAQGVWRAAPPTGLVEGHLAPWILWQIWLARNSLCFNNTIVTGKLCNSTVRRGLESFQSKSRTGLEFKASARNLVGIGEYNSSSFSAYSRRAGIEEGNYRE